tara:strand:- start:21066 stop:22280 length:1215 start_codon:yes stop_codon:yes gene_type:complete
VGCIGKIGLKEKSAFEAMLVMDVLRGKHSTGVTGVKADGSWTTAKIADVPHVLFDMKKYDKLKAQQNWVLMGHNRYATKGEINSRNAHPFEMEDVVGCHNGTIRTQWRLPDYRDFDVDSENIFHSVQQQGLEDTLAILDGAYALTYWDKRTHQFVVVRNNERPLYYALSKDEKTLFYASEAWMINVACGRENIPIKTVVDIRKNTIYRFDIDMRHNGDDIMADMESFDPFVPPVTTYSSYSTGGRSASGSFPSGQGSTTAKQTGTQTTAKEAEKKPPVSSYNKSPETAAMEKIRDMYVKTYVTFEVVTDSTSESGQSYVSCKMANTSADMECRVFVGKDFHKEVYDDLKSQHDCLFQAEVVGVGIDFRNGNKTPYLCLNYKTLSVLEDEEDDDIPFQAPTPTNS